MILLFLFYGQVISETSCQSGHFQTETVNGIFIGETWDMHAQISDYNKTRNVKTTGA